MQTFDIIFLGNHPIGALSSAILAKKGLRVALVNPHNPTPQCPPGPMPNEPEHTINLFLRGLSQRPFSNATLEQLGALQLTKINTEHKSLLYQVLSPQYRFNVFSSYKHNQEEFNLQFPKLAKYYRAYYELNLKLLQRSNSFLRHLILEKPLGFFKKRKFLKDINKFSDLNAPITESPYADLATSPLAPIVLAPIFFYLPNLNFNNISTLAFSRILAHHADALCPFENNLNILTQKDFGQIVFHEKPKNIILKSNKILSIEFENQINISAPIYVNAQTPNNPIHKNVPIPEPLNTLSLLKTIPPTQPTTPKPFMTQAFKINKKHVPSQLNQQALIYYPLKNKNTNIPLLLNQQAHANNDNHQWLMVSQHHHVNLDKNQIIEAITPFIPYFKENILEYTTHPHTQLLTWDSQTIEPLAKAMVTKPQKHMRNVFYAQNQTHFGMDGQFFDLLHLTQHLLNERSIKKLNKTRLQGAPKI